MTCASHDEPRPSITYQGQPMTVDLNNVTSEKPMLMTVDLIDSIEVGAVSHLRNPKSIHHQPMNHQPQPLPQPLPPPFPKHKHPSLLHKIRYSYQMKR